MLYTDHCAAADGAALLMNGVYVGGWWTHKSTVVLVCGLGDLASQPDILPPCDIHTCRMVVPGQCTVHLCCALERRGFGQISSECQLGRSLLPRKDYLDTFS